MKNRTLRLVLGDQLNEQHSWFSRTDNNATYVMMEILGETNYVKHHIQKVCGFFGAMRAFCTRMRQAGHRFIYLALDSPDNAQSFEENILRLISRHQISRFEYQLPDEYRLDQLLADFAAGLPVTTSAVDSEHFLAPRDIFSTVFQKDQKPLMETFYRYMRRQTGILMDGPKPLSGRWNYDAENRKSLPKDIQVPAHLNFAHDVSDIADMIATMKVETIGNIKAEKFPWPLTRGEALRLLDFFLSDCLAKFGAYQDAMHSDHAFIFHSRLSFAMNIKLIGPEEVLKKTLQYWESNTDTVDIAQVEGFIRQILGWREFMRGVYWHYMPGYQQLNHLGHDSELPAFFWTGDTRMNCLHHAIKQSLDHAYAHHIQRLMVTGNFANLLGVHPDAVDEWYLGIYIDAIQWVEITNTRGMSQFADGGITATKPYVSSANYINKMSNYCKSCFYNNKQRYGEGACPFNSLYWDYFERHRDKLANNPRIGMAYRNLARMAPEELAAIRKQAAIYRANADRL